MLVGELPTHSSLVGGFVIVFFRDEEHCLAGSWLGVALEVETVIYLLSLRSVTTLEHVDSSTAGKLIFLTYFFEATDRKSVV